MSVEYTDADYYTHPTLNRGVVLVGMSHYGSPSYYARAKEILAKCDLVLFEDIVPERLTGNKRSEKIQRWRQLLFSDSLDEAATVAIWWTDHLYPLLLELPYEGDFFGGEYQQAHWVNADTLKDEEANRRVDEEVHKFIAAFSLEDKQFIVDHARRIVLRITEGTFLLQDLLLEEDWFASEWFSRRQDVYSECDKLFLDPRDAHCFEVFDRLVEERDPKFVGIKFGAGHMPAMQRMLEERGYVYQKSDRLTVFCY